MSSSHSTIEGPEILEPIFENIPEEITPETLLQWVLWRLETPYWAKQQGKSTLAKIPRQIGGGYAKSNDPRTWTCHRAVVEGYTSLCPDNPYSGVGLILTQELGIVGVDLDKVRDPKSGRVLPEAMDLIERLASYAEVSPSGTGVKIFVRGVLPVDCPCSLKGYFGPGTALELFDGERMMCMTGHRLPRSPETINSRQDALAAVVEQAISFKQKEQAKRNALRPAMPFVARDTSTVDEQERIRLAKKYFRKIPPAVSGQGGHCQTLWAARVLVWGFEIDAETAFAVLSEWNETCVPSWSEKDLRRKIREAETVDFRYPRGWLLAKQRLPAVGARPMRWEGSCSPLAIATLPAAPRASETGNSEFDEREADETPTAAPFNSVFEDVRSDQDPVVSGKRTEPTNENEKYVPLGSPDPETGRTVLKPTITLPSVDAFRRRYYRHDDGWTIANQGGVFFVWKGNRYVVIEDELIRQSLGRFLHEALRYEKNRKTGDLNLVRFESNPATVESVLKTLRTESCVPASQLAPMWINGGRGPNSCNLLAFPSGTLNIETGEVFQPTPLLFNFNAIDFEYDPHAPPAERWHDFLQELWPGDLEAIQLLQECFGYFLMGDVSLQKALYIIGPRRSGKGTIARVLGRLIGRANICGPSTANLCERFGLAELVGKSLAIVSDARFHGDIGVAVERLLRIIGEDEVSVEAKYRSSVTMKLPVRFLFLGNELPKFSDASNALVGRFLMLKIIPSFYGKEDPLLTDKLLQELPGILLWAIEGANRLQKRGFFLQPKSGAGLIEQLEDMTSKVGPFVQEHCEVGDAEDPTLRVSKSAIYAQFRLWCEQVGRKNVPEMNIFGRDLMSAFPFIHAGRNPEAPDGEKHFYKGIRLTNRLWSP